MHLTLLLVDLVLVGSRARLLLIYLFLSVSLCDFLYYHEIYYIFDQCIFRYVPVTNRADGAVKSAAYNRTVVPVSISCVFFFF